MTEVFAALLTRSVIFLEQHYQHSLPKQVKYNFERDSPSIVLKGEFKDSSSRVEKEFSTIFFLLLKNASGPLDPHKFLSQTIDIRFANCNLMKNNILTVFG